MRMEGDATLAAASCPAIASFVPCGACRWGRRDQRKEVPGNVNPYEVLLLLDPELPDERQSEIVTRVRENVEGAGGTWERHDPWGRRKLAYEIDRRTDGSYHLLEFQSEPATLDEISRVLKITDGVLRHLAVRRTATGPSRPVAAEAANGQDEAHTETTVEEGA